MRLRALLLPLFSLATAALLAGCSAGSRPADVAVAGRGFSGSVMGGLQPIGFSSIQLFAPGSGGYGLAATPLLRVPVTSDANGGFSITGDYTCPSAATPVYLTVTGGNPGLPAGSNNAAIAMMEVLGPCGNLTPDTYVTINELTTVAAVYALQPFMSSYTQVSAPASNAAGLSSAFVTAFELVTILGHSPGNAPGIATVPSTEINTLADALSACVNSNGSTGSFTSCGSLFTAATPPSGVAPTDISAATLNIARNPGRNVAAVFNTILPSAPYKPDFTTAPADWTIAINYLAPAFRTPSDLAIDGQGAVWVIAAPGTLSNGSSTLVSLTAPSGITGTFPQQSAAYGNLAIDAGNNLWLSNTNANNVVAFTPSGSRVSSVPYTGGGITGPGPLAFDPAGNLWVSNNSATVSELNASGQPVSPARGYNTGSANGPVALALDAAGNVWTTDSAGNAVTKMSNAGVAASGSPFTGGTLSSPFSIAIDAANGAYAANRTGNSLTHFTSGNAQSGTSGAGLNGPVALVLDGLGTAWAANGNANTVSVVNNSGTAGGISTSGTTGYGAAFLTNPYKLAIDNTGSVWVANLGTKVAGSGTITQIVGAAAPVVTPLAVAVGSNKLAQRP